MLNASRPKRRAWTVRPNAPRRLPPRRAFVPSLQALEGRRLLSSTGDAFAPTDAEQFMLAAINRARANPSAEGKRLVALAQTDPLLQAATSGWDLNVFLQVISSAQPAPPLAFNTRLNEAAFNQSMAMLQANSQFHSPSGYLTDASVAHSSDGRAFYPSGNNWWATGENVFAYSNGVSGDVSAFVNYFEAGFLLDWGNPDFGHLTNLLAPGPGEWSPGSGGHYPYSEIGIGLLTNVAPSASTGGLDVGPDLVTQEFGWRSGNPILTGVLFTDTAGTGAYFPGEGLGGVVVRAVGRNGQGTFVATTWASGGYSLPLPPGTYDVSAAGNIPYPVATTVTLGRDNVEWDWGYRPASSDLPIPGDFRGVGFAELAVYRPGTSHWYFDGQASSLDFGGPGLDLPVPGNYDGIARNEPALYRPSTAQWFVYGPGGGRLATTFGWANVDIPLPGDYDGVGHVEPAVYRPTTAEWFVYGPGGGRLAATFGWAGVDIPVPGDYGGVGRAEPAVYRPTTGEWFVLGPSGGAKIATLGQPGTDIPVPGDYDGVGRAEPAVYRPSTAQWFILGPNGVRTFSFGAPNVDVPLRVDFDGDGRTDPAVYRPPTGDWFVKLSTTGVVVTRQFGQGGVSPPIASWLDNFTSHLSPQVSRTVVPASPVSWGIPASSSLGGPPTPKGGMTVTRVRPAESLPTSTIERTRPQVGPTSVRLEPARRSKAHVRWKSDLPGERRGTGQVFDGANGSYFAGVFKYLSRNSIVSAIVCLRSSPPQP